MTQCKFPIKVEAENTHLLFCIKEKNHVGLHEFWIMPVSMSIIQTLKELLWYRWEK